MCEKNDSDGNPIGGEYGKSNSNSKSKRGSW